MIWKRKPAAGRASDDDVMKALRAEIRKSAPSLVDGSVIKDGVLTGPPGWALMTLPNHTDSPQHFDIGFVPAMDRPGSAVLPDCISGMGTGKAATESMTHIWRETSGACFLELLTRRGDFASHLDGSDPGGLKGWHSVVSGVIGYGTDDASNDALQAAVLRNQVLTTLSPVLLEAFDRPAENAIKIFYFRTPRGSTAEVRVNGSEVPAASRALDALPWPVVRAPAIARFYAVAVHPEGVSS